MNEWNSWFDTLVKPSWNPPSWVFGPVWSVLYIMMALAALRVWKEQGFVRGAFPLSIFAVQLALNVAWPWIFFTRHQIGFAFAEIIVLWLAIAVTVFAFWRVSPINGILLLPYLAWVTFASVLNGAFWRLNS